MKHVGVVVNFAFTVTNPSKFFSKFSFFFLENKKKKPEEEERLLRKKNTQNKPAQNISIFAWLLTKHAEIFFVAYENISSSREEKKKITQHTTF